MPCGGGMMWVSCMQGEHQACIEAKFWQLEAASYFQGKLYLDSGTLAKLGPSSHWRTCQAGQPDRRLLLFIIFFKTLLINCFLGHTKWLLLVLHSESTLAGWGPSGILGIKPGSFWIGRKQGKRPTVLFLQLQKAASESYPPG